MGAAVMIRPDFIVGIVVGAVAVYVWHHYQSQKG